MVSDLTDRIQSLGHWQTAIYPRDFDSTRVEYGELEGIINRCVVRLRGWPVPFIDYNYERGTDWIGQDIAPRNGVEHMEAWRFFTSGQFTQLRVFSAESDVAPPPPAGSSSVIQVWEILYYLTELFELAARLSVTAAGDEWITVSAALHGLNGRSLVIGQPGRSDFGQPKVTSAQSLQQNSTLLREALVADPRTHAIAMTREFVVRFGWDASTDQLADLQGGLLTR